MERGNPIPSSLELSDFPLFSVVCLWALGVGVCAEPGLGQGPGLMTELLTLLSGLGDMFTDKDASWETIRPNRARAMSFRM